MELPPDCVELILALAGAPRPTAWPLWVRPQLRLPWMPGALRRCCGLLHTLELQHTPLAPAAGALLAQQLPRSLRSLRRLALGQNDTDLSGLLALPRCSLRALCVGGRLYSGSCSNDLDCTLMTRGWRPPLGSALRTLSLAHTFPCVDSLCGTLAGARCLRELDVSENGLDGASLLRLVRAMQGWGGVRRLELGYNQLRDAGPLLAALAPWRRLAYLGLGCNHLAQFVPVPLPQLIELVLECNALVTADVRRIWAALCRGELPRLAVLDMEDNEIELEHGSLRQQLERRLEHVSLRSGW
jgi:hypothetical protein